MRRRKPDLLFLLSLLLVTGIIITSYGTQLIEGLNVEAKPATVPVITK